MGLFGNSTVYPPEALLSATFVTFGQSIRAMSLSNALTESETYKYWDLFTWNLDSLVQNRNLTSQQANFILEATGHPVRDKFELSFTPRSSAEDFLKKQLIAKSFFDYYMNAEAPANSNGTGFELLDIPAFIRNIDFTWDRDPSYKGFIKVLAIYLATTLRDTARISKSERKQRRESAFFWGALFIAQWTERHPSN